MFRSLLVPLDGTSFAETAVAPAIALAKRFGARVILVRTAFTVEAPDTPPEMAWLGMAPAAEEYLKTVAKRVHAEGLEVVAVLPPEHPVEGIADEARYGDVDLIVMATHGRKGVDALLHPSVTWGVLQENAAPILAFRVMPEKVADPFPRFLRDATAPILVPLDGSAQAEEALTVAVKLAREFGNPLVLVRAAEQPVLAGGAVGYADVLGQAVQWSIEEAESYLKRKQLELTGMGVQAQIRVALAPPAQLIEMSVKEDQAGLVVMASHGRGWLGRLVLGSVARSVLGAVEVPVLLVRRQAMQDEVTETLELAGAGKPMK
jgi:nucleotide-binding universal stress UspA family protein